MDPLHTLLRASSTLTLALPKRGLLEDMTKDSAGQVYLGYLSAPNKRFQEMDIPVGQIFAAQTITN
jgi:hypothetical protein